MLLWVLIASLTAAAILAVLLPLSRTPRADNSAAHAARVYRDQLAELERDKAEGRIGESDAEAARAEIARRLIAADAEAKAVDGTEASRVPRRAIAIVALIGIPALSLSLYLGLGSPSLPGQPLAERLSTPAGPDSIETLIAKVEAHLSQSPEDGRGWDVIAPVYLRLGQVDDAARAYRNAIRILGSNADRQSGLGEALLAAEGGIVTQEARNAFEAARALDPKAPGPRYFIALAAEQEGKLDEAAKELRALIADVPSDAPFRGVLQQALARVDPSSAPPGPTSEDVAAAADMPEGDRTKMIEGMVAQLAARLKDSPDDSDGWQRLIRSYVVLGRGDAAAEAARDALSGVQDEAGRKQIQSLIIGLGVTPATGTSETASASPATSSPPSSSTQSAPLPGPTSADVAAAQSMSAGDRSTMIEGMVARLAARLKDQPDDTEGWLRLIRSYSVLGKSDAAAEAARDALSGVQDPAGRQQIQSLVAELGVTPAAGTAETAAASPAPSSPPSPPPESAPLPGPTAADVAAAQDMSAGDRSTMIEGMVARLAARLKDQPDDTEGWLRLIRSYSVLGKSDAAAEAARDALSGVQDPAGRQQIQSLVAELGITPAAGTAETAAASPGPSSPPSPPAQAAPLPGPTAADVAAAQDMSAGDRSAMIEGMVSNLAARLKEQPNDVEGWLRLIRSYSVLGKSDAAAGAARDALNGVEDPAGRQQIQALVAQLGVTPAGAATQ